jgi:group I intron endonuclease
MEKLSVIYIIENQIDGKFYLGSSCEHEKRKKRHISDLRKGKHHNIYLQRSYDKHGESNFIFKIIKEIPSHLQFIEEQLLLDSMDYTKCYNLSKKAKGGDLISYHPDKKIFIGEMVKKIKKLREAGLLKIPDNKGDKNPNWQGGISISYCSCGIEKTKSANTCSKCRDRTGSNNPFYGKTHTKEVIDKLKISNTGKTNKSQMKPVIIENIEYISLSEASRKIGKNASTILFRIRSKNPKFKNYNYKK